MRWLTCAAVPCLLAGLAVGVLALPAAQETPGDHDRWPNLWNVLRLIRDTTASKLEVAGTAVSSAKESVTQGVSGALDAAKTKAESAGKQASDKVASMWWSVRNSAANTFQDAIDKLKGGAVPEKKQQLQLIVVDKEVTSSASSNRSREEPPSGPRYFVSSALERVKGAAQTFGDVGRSLGDTMGRWGRVMAGTVGSAADAVNTALGTVLQVINGGTPDGDHVCFAEVDCFDLHEPWISQQRPLPRMNDPDEIQTRFFLCTRNMTEPEEFFISDQGNSSFVPERMTFVIVHGFNDKIESPWIVEMKDALLERVDSNVVLVDWSQGAQASRNYLQAAANSRVVGVQLARVLEYLAERAYLAYDLVHLVGHSLGAHAAGYAGKKLNGVIGRITALDAAQPAFEDQVAAVRIAPTDARFVDAVHTNGAPFIPTLGLGMMQPVGHVDFYVNGGALQPGCFVPKLPPVKSILDVAALPVNVLGDMLSCSHRRAIDYFIEAVRSDCHLWGKREEIKTSTSASTDGVETSWLRPSAASARLTSSSWSRALTSTSALSSIPLLASVFSFDTKPTTESPSKASTQPIEYKARRSETVADKTERTKDDNPSEATTLSSESSLEGDATNGPSEDNILEASDKAEAVEAVTLYSDRRPTSEPTRGLQSRALSLQAPAWCEDQCVPLGLDTAYFTLRGSFVLATAAHPPYCMTEITNEV